MTSRVDKAREIVGHPLTLTEKILYNHLWDGMPSKVFARTDYVDFFSRQVACQDATAQMALLQFMHAGKAQVVPTTVHCDHLIQAKVDAVTDLARAKHKVMKIFFSSVSNKYGIGFGNRGWNYSSGSP
jgi:aconitate hydratase